VKRFLALILVDGLVVLLVRLIRRSGLLSNEPASTPQFS
jgi:hypothetical protein